HDNRTDGEGQKENQKAVVGAAFVDLCLATKLRHGGAPADEQPREIVGTCEKAEDLGNSQKTSLFVALRRLEIGVGKFDCFGHALAKAAVALAGAFDGTDRRQEPAFDELARALMAYERRLANRFEFLVQEVIRICSDR